MSSFLRIFHDSCLIFKIRQEPWYILMLDTRAEGGKYFKGTKPLLNPLLPRLYYINKSKTLL